jgi:UDP-N-acetylmuramoyl-tripeptide--D-alanyl-D-alanine ligase
MSSIENYEPGNSRSQLIHSGSNKIILDAYNANPSSMKAAIENLSKIEAREKILILGAMAELGKDSLREHQDIINLISQYPWNDVVLVGGDFLKINHPYKKFTDANEAKEWFRSQKIHDSYVLIKGSRSMQMEKVIEP